MRTFVSSFSMLSVLLMLASGAGAAGTVPGRLESVSILAAGTGSSLAVRTSVIAPLVATTAADARTLVIELVGIAADRRDMSAQDASGMISRIAIDMVSRPGNVIVTRIRVSLARPYRHRVRISGSLVYVDFERVEPVERAKLPVQARDVGSPQRPAAPPKAAPVSAARVPGNAVAKPPAPSAPTPEVNLLSRWLAITEPLQHTSSPPAAAPVLAGAWIPLVLKGGATIFSYGDYAAEDEQFTFLLPFDDSDAPRVEAVSIPRSVVDVEATARASESVRASRYLTTRGALDFADLGRDVSTALNRVPSQPDPIARMELVEGVRRRLIEWPGAHYGYRARDVNEAVSMLDPILSQFRSAAGVNRIDLSLVAPTGAPLPAVAIRQPTLVDLIENAMRLVTLLTVPAERTAVLRTAAASLERHRAELPVVWLETGQRRVLEALRSEIRIDDAYGKLSADVITRAVRAAAEGNVRAISALQSDLMERDRRLGGARRDVLVSTMAALRTQYDLAARIQLQRDQRTMGAEAVRTYADQVEPALKRFESLRGDLREFDRISTASSKAAPLRDSIEFVKRRLTESQPPPQVVEAHGLLLTAVYLASVALQDTVDPRLTRDMASSVRASAASEALTMFDRGRQAIEAARRKR